MTTSSSISPFQLHPATPTPTNHAFILSTFDSSLPFLASIGSHEQWGKTLFSQRGDFSEETLKELGSSEEYRLTGTSSIDGNLRIFIAERELFNHHHTDSNKEETSEFEFVRVTSDGRRFLPVGFGYVRENWVPNYVKIQAHLPMPDGHITNSASDGGGGFLYIEVMVTDRSGGDDRRELSRGAGAALIKGIRAYGEAKGMKTLWVDGWAGNERKLIRYYEEQGFQAVGEWSHIRANNVPWLGTLMCMEI